MQQPQHRHVPRARRQRGRTPAQHPYLDRYRCADLFGHAVIADRVRWWQGALRRQPYPEPRDLQPAARPPERVPAYPGPDHLGAKDSYAGNPSGSCPMSWAHISSANRRLPPCGLPPERLGLRQDLDLAVPCHRDPDAVVRRLNQQKCPRSAPAPGRLPCCETARTEMPDPGPGASPAGTSARSTISGTATRRVTNPG